MNVANLHERRSFMEEKSSCVYSEIIAVLFILSF